MCIFFNSVMLLLYWVFSVLICHLRYLHDRGFMQMRPFLGSLRYMLLFTNRVVNFEGSLLKTIFTDLYVLFNFLTQIMKIRLLGIFAKLSPTYFYEYSKYFKSWFHKCSAVFKTCLLLFQLLFKPVDLENFQHQKLS